MDGCINESLTLYLHRKELCIGLVCSLDAVMDELILCVVPWQNVSYLRLFSHVSRRSFSVCLEQSSQAVCYSEVDTNIMIEKYPLHVLLKLFAYYDIAVRVLLSCGNALMMCSNTPVAANSIHVQKI